MLPLAQRHAAAVFVNSVDGLHARGSPMKKLILAVLLTLAIGGAGVVAFYAPPAQADCGANHTS